MRDDKSNIIVDKTFLFALEIVKFVEQLEKDKRFVISKQLLRSGTSIGTNVREAQNAESKADFIHKMKIAAKEVDETDYWLMICKHSEGYCYHENLELMLKEIIKILSKIISSSKTI